MHNKRWNGLDFGKSFNKDRELECPFCMWRNDLDNMRIEIGVNENVVYHKCKNCSKVLFTSRKEQDDMA